MFEIFESKPVVRRAVEITESDEIAPIDNIRAVFIRGNQRIEYTRAAEEADGDFIIKESDDDIYHCPRAVFEQKYRPMNNTGLTFGEAIEAAKSDKKIARKGWNGKNMFVVYMPPLKLPPYNTTDTARKVNDRTAKFIGEDQPLDCQPYFAMYNAQGQWIPGWLASQTDMLAEDWCII